MPLDFNFIENLIGCNKTTYKVHDHREQSYEHLPIWNKVIFTLHKVF